MHSQYGENNRQRMSAINLNTNNNTIMGEKGEENKYRTSEDPLTNLMGKCNLANSPQASPEIEAVIEEYAIDEPTQKHAKYKMNYIDHLINKYNLFAKRKGGVIMSVISIILFGLLVCLISPNRVLNLLIIVQICVILILVFAIRMLAWIMRFDEGPQDMRTLAHAIREGSEGFVAVQYGAIARITVYFAALIVIIYAFTRNTSLSVSGGIGLSNSCLALITGVTFMAGAFCSAVAGYAGMWVSVRTNVRVASAARRCYNSALKLCFRGGAFSSVINIALAITGISSSVFLVHLFFPRIPFVQVPLLIVGYGFGASLVAMFAQLGGGIYTKAADVGADLVGKIEAGIPEDDARNPAVIADLVGDNVGDCAGQCADVFESIAAEIISAMILGGALASKEKFSPNVAAGYVLFPLFVHCADIVISSVGVLLVRTKPGMPDIESAGGGQEDPLKIMIRGFGMSCLLGVFVFTLLCRCLLHFSESPNAWKYYALCGAIGMICAFSFVVVTQYYTDYNYSQVKRIAEASVTGPATNIIAGMSVGMKSTMFPVIIIGAAIITTYRIGRLSSVSMESQHIAGLFGTAVATMGMLCTAGYVLAMSGFGPIADNAGGIVEMTSQPEYVRAITDRLDAVGNVTKANTKGFSVGSASLACFLLFSAFMDEFSIYAGVELTTINIATPEVFVAGVLGSMTVFLFSAWSLEAVGRTAQQVVQEVRRQFADNPGIMTYHVKPDYHTCVAIVSREGLREMLKPGLLSIFAPLSVGIIFRGIGTSVGNQLMSGSAMTSFLMFATVTGVLMALYLNNSGGAWDNAKKYVETGALGGKNSAAHKAAVVGDTVGDPCKDTAGPSLHVLIKLISTVTLVLTPLFVSNV